MINKSRVIRTNQILARGYNKKSNWKIQICEDESPTLARIIIKEKWDGNPKKSKELLEEICTKWPIEKKVKFTITCGGFIIPTLLI